MLLPHRMIGCSLRTHQWYALHFDHVKKIECLSSESSLDFDLIASKKKGTCLLFHGAPGTGKRITAEAISEKWTETILCISPADLGTTSLEIKQRLDGFLWVAERWNGVLILEGADFFLSSRTKNDMERNVIVIDSRKGSYLNARCAKCSPFHVR